MCLHLSFCLVLIIYQGVLLDKISIRIFLFLNKILTAKTLLLFPDAFINWMVQEKKKKKRIMGPFGLNLLLLKLKTENTVAK